MRGRLPSNDQIALRAGPSNGKCALCENPEDVEHIFFTCHLARFMWAGIREMLEVPWDPRSRLEWLHILEGFRSKSRRFLWVLFSAMSWAIWTTRNKFTIEAKFPRQPADCIFKLIINLQLWRALQRRQDVELLDEAVVLLKQLFAKTYSPPPPLVV